MVACRMEEAFNTHQPVLLQQVLRQLAIQPDGIYVDATFGRGGHSRAILSHLSPHGKLLAIDQDPQAVAFARSAEAEFSQDPRFSIAHASFAELPMVVAQHHLTGKINGILFDLGISSPQLDEPARGFSFMREGPLDMRMDTSQGISAAEWLATVDEKTLGTVLWRYGEEKHARRIARAILSYREKQPITTTIQLATIIAEAMPRFQKGKHPATRSFQAIRIFINQEMEKLSATLVHVPALLAQGGRLVVISFHSLEDRIVKQFIRGLSRQQEFPKGLPVKQSVIFGNFQSVGRAIRPEAEEVALNPRARSAVLRTGEKLL